MSLTISIDGDVRLIRKLEDAIEKIGSPEPALSEVGDVLKTEFYDNFPTEGRRLNEQWKALAASTLKQKIAMGYGGQPILVRTGTLQSAFAKELSKYSVRVHNPTHYFKYHQLGGGSLPQRRMILFPERLKQEVVAVFTEFIHEALN